MPVKGMHDLCPRPAIQFGQNLIFFRTARGLH
jgi:hypothetical protein